MPTNLSFSQKVSRGAGALHTRTITHNHFMHATMIITKILQRQQLQCTRIHLYPKQTHHTHTHTNEQNFTPSLTHHQNSLTKHITFKFEIKHSTSKSTTVEISYSERLFVRRKKKEIVFIYYFVCKQTILLYSIYAFLNLCLE